MDKELTFLSEHLEIQGIRNLLAGLGGMKVARPRKATGGAQLKQIRFLILKRAMPGLVPWEMPTHTEKALWFFWKSVETCVLWDPELL